MFKKLTKPFRHNIGLTIGVFIAGCVLVWTFGCQVTTKSVQDPNAKVTRAELDAEVENLSNKISIAYADIQRQEEIRAKLLNIGVAYMSGDVINPVGVVTSLVALAGLGCAVDNRRKDKVIKKKKAELEGKPKKK